MTITVTVFRLVFSPVYHISDDKDIDKACYAKSCERIFECAFISTRITG